MASCKVYNCLIRSRLPQTLQRGSRSLATSWCNELQQHPEKKEISAVQSTAGVSTNKAVSSYLQKVINHQKFIVEKKTEFEIGRRHLANMMGMDPDTFSQEDIDSAISYLLPSGLYEPTARPLMRPPEEVFKTQKEAQFDSTGRPFHTLFFTLKPNYFQTLHDISGHVIELNKFEDMMLMRPNTAEIVDRLSLGGSEWCKKSHVESILLESIKFAMYDELIMSLERLAEHPYANRVKDFVMKFRRPLKVVTKAVEIPEIQMDSSGRRFVISEGTRKTAKAVVKVLENGSGHFNINGKSILYFCHPQQREQVILPLQVCGLLGKMDVVCQVQCGGISGQSGAIRFALALALQPFLDKDTIEKMRLAGLLTLDERRCERHKPGLKGARAQYAWRKR